MAREQFSTARELIAQKRYDEARALLNTIDHPTAREWLERLDAMAPYQESQQFVIAPISAPTPLAEVASGDGTSDLLQSLANIEFLLTRLHSIGEQQLQRTRQLPVSNSQSIPIETPQTHQLIAISAVFAALTGAAWVFWYLINTTYGSYYGGTSIWAYVAGLEHGSDAFQGTEVLTVAVARFILGFGLSWIIWIGALAILNVIVNAVLDVILSISRRIR